MSDSEDEGPPQLSSYALAALQEFYAEQQHHHSDLCGDDKYNIGIIEENWVSDHALHPSGRVGSVECVLYLVHCWSLPHLTAQFVSLVTRKLIACSVAKTGSADFPHSDPGCLVVRGGDVSDRGRDRVQQTVLLVDRFILSVFTGAQHSLWEGIIAVRGQLVLNM